MQIVFGYGLSMDVNATKGFLLQPCQMLHFSWVPFIIEDTY